MEIPVHLSSKGVDLLPAQEEMVRDEVKKLQRFYDRIVASWVAVTVPNRYPDGTPVMWAIRVELSVPGRELAVSRHVKSSFKDALDDAFGAARRILQDHVRELRGDVKVPTGTPKGVVTRLFGYEGYGFITSDDGREIYFHRNSVPGGFDQLAVGAAVRFAETEGESGPQASTVIPIGRPSAVSPE